MAYIYGLRLVNDTEYRYVGLTTKTLDLRLAWHWRGAGSGSVRLEHAWMREHGKLRIAIDEIEMCNLQKTAAREIFWIAYFLDKGHRLFNISPGGQLQAKETKEKIGNANRGRKQDPELIKRRTRSQKGTSETAEAKKHMREAQFPLSCVSCKKTFQSLAGFVAHRRGKHEGKVYKDAPTLSSCVFCRTELMTNAVGRANHRRSYSHAK